VDNAKDAQVLKDLIVQVYGERNKSKISRYVSGYNINRANKEEVS